MTNADADGATLRDRVADAAGATVVAAEELDGGMVGRVHRVDLDDGRTVVAKTGDTPLSVEGRMLTYLAEHSDLPVPAVHHASDDLLLLEYVEGASTVTPAVERDAADHLAALHGVSADAFGFPFDTLTGPLDQPNPWSNSWVAFFREHRLLSMAREARENGPLSADLFDRVTSLAAGLDDLLCEPDGPALLHGDVWRTNLLTDGERVLAFLDPATYYGHTEVELAYVDWTGTFGDPFFERYRERAGLDDGFFDRRRHVYAVYPLLTHVRLFGDRYAGTLDRTLSRVGY